MFQNEIVGIKYLEIQTVRCGKKYFFCEIQITEREIS